MVRKPSLCKVNRNYVTGIKMLNACSLYHKYLDHVDYPNQEC